MLQNNYFINVHFCMPSPLAPDTIRVQSCVCHVCLFSHERGKAGGHEPPLFPLPYHHIWLFKTTFLNGIIRAFKVWFLKIQQRHAKKHNSNHFLNSKLDWYFVCWILKLFCNEIFDKFDWVLHLEISQSVMIIQLLTHYTKSILKSLINQLPHHPITS